MYLQVILPNVNRISSRFFRTIFLKFLLLNCVQDSLMKIKDYLDVFSELSGYWKKNWACLWESIHSYLKHLQFFMLLMLQFNIKYNKSETVQNIQPKKCTIIRSKIQDNQTACRVVAYFSKLQNLSQKY